MGVYYLLKPQLLEFSALRTQALLLSILLCCWKFEVCGREFISVVEGLFIG